MSGTILFSLLIINTVLWLWLAVRESPRTELDRITPLFVIACIIAGGSSLLSALVVAWAGEYSHPDLGITRVEAALPLFGFPAAVLIVVAVVFLVRRRR